MENSESNTFFAPSERSSIASLKAQHKLARDPELLANALDQLPHMVLLLNGNREIVYANQQVLAFLNLQLKDALGKRPGEAFNCIHSCHEDCQGCGTSRFCRECGAVRSILNAQSGHASEEECRMIVRRRDNEQAINLRVWSIPISFQNHSFILFTLKDIGDEKRLDMIAKSFFHSLLNQMSSLNLFLEGMRRGAIQANAETFTEMIDLIRFSSNAIQEQQRMLYLDEGEEIHLHPIDFSVAEMLTNLTESYKKNSFPQHTQVEIEIPDRDVKINTDRTLLECAFGNLIKNAFEASQNEDPIKIGYRKEKNGHLFSVRNKAVIPERDQLQIFQRSFTTKGKGRGFGTHNAKVIVETLLRGHIQFESNKKSGTTFSILLP